MHLKPRYYEFKTDEQYRFLRLPKGKHYGLIAQDVETLLPNLVSTADHEVVHPMSIQNGQTSVIAAPDPNPSKESITIKALNYTELIPIMIKGIQELNEKLIQENSQLTKEIVEIKQMVKELKNSNANNNAPLASAYLEQNVPNPASGKTTIRYYVPISASAAKVTITNIEGQLLKVVVISNKGIGQLNIKSTELTAGAYNYSLWMDGKQVDTKRMIIAR